MRESARERERDRESARARERAREVSGRIAYVRERDGGGLETELVRELVVSDLHIIHVYI